MAKLITCKIKPYIQPFERKLAFAELTALAGDAPEALKGKNCDQLFSLQTDASAEELAGRLSYWEFIEQDYLRYTDQVLREATVNLVRNGIALDKIENLVAFDIQKGIPNRRCLRYGTHGLHEYRGKFFPQLVRSLINIAEVPKIGGLIADPMSGSGTTLVEGLLAGCDAIGFDMNPLSVFIGKTKCELLSTNPQKIIEAFEETVEKLNDAKNRMPEDDELKYFHSLPEVNQAYLVNWFSPRVLLQLDTIFQTINKFQTSVVVKNFLSVCFSNILRRVSWQKDTDLRVRREVKPDAEISVFEIYIEELKKSVKTVSALLYRLEAGKIGSFDLREGDACRIGQQWKQHAGRVDAVITSPPYATALPYLDTDRLSILYLGLLTRREQRSRDYQMIGNREVTEKMRRQFWENFQMTKQNFPASVVSLVEKINELNSAAASEAGFRRKNLPALLVKYFSDMTEALRGIYEILKPGAPAYVVIGNNHTIAGGEKIQIKTAELLSEIAETNGFEIGEPIAMEMLASREIFKKNAVASEMILCLRRPAK